jgi:hypothetical protein
LFNGGLALILGGISVVLRALAVDPAANNAALEPSTGFLVIAAVGLGALAIYLLLGALKQNHRWLLRVAAVIVGAALLLDARSLHAGELAGPLPFGHGLHLLNALGSAWFSGSILLAMILGHFYLVIPKLSIEPLRHLFRFSLFGLIARIVVVAITGALWFQAGGAALLTVQGFLGQGVFVLQRLLFGILIPTSLAYYTWKTIEMRSTQSATGILYVVVFLSMVGEALSVYLSLETGIPL